MKRTFLRILPLAVAVLLATSCSKEENNTNEVVNNGQENVQTKTMPVSITVNQKGLSKLSCANSTGVDLQPTFESTDKLAIYKGENLLKSLTPSSISQDGKSATFEGEITAEGIVDGETILTATIGTQITEAQTASSREGAVKTGCYQTAEFTYSSEGNEIQLEEQNAYIEVVWKNKGGETVEFTVNDSKTVSLHLNDKGHGWIVAPAGTKFTCAALGLTNETTTAAANIYGITREYKAVQSVSINTNGVTSKVWGNAAFDVTVSISPSDATNQTVDWSKSTNVKVTDKGNGTYSVLITGNTGGKATLIATVDGVSSTAAEISVDANYVDLGTGVYWKTSDEGSYPFNNLPSGTPTKEQFSKLWDGTVTVSGTIFTNKNGSGASITLTSGDYWSSTPYGSSNGWCVYVGSGFGNWHHADEDDDKRVRLVRAAQ